MDKCEHKDIFIKVVNLIAEYSQENNVNIYDVNAYVAEELQRVIEAKDRFNGS